MSSSKPSAPARARRAALLAAVATGCAAWSGHAGASAATSPTSATSATPPAPRPSLCVAGEVAVFSCQVSGGKTASLCASADLGDNAGTLTYRFGRAGRLELVFPDPPAHPKALFRRGSVGSAGGGGDYVRFTRDAHTYTLWADVGPAGEHAGVAVARDGRTLASLPCRTSALDPDENWARVYKARLPRKDEPFTPPAPTR